MMLSKLQRRGLAFVLAFAMTFSLVPVTGFATETEPVTVATTVPETEPTVMETTVPETEPVVEATASTEAVTEPTVETEAATEPDVVSEIEPVTETAPVDNSVTEEEETLPEKMDHILLKYLGATVLTEDAIMDAVNTMLWEEMEAALAELNALEPMITALTEEEIAQLEESYESTDTIVCFYETLQLAMTPSFFAETGTYEPVTGVTVDVSGATNNSMSGGVLTVTAKGSAGFLGMGASAKTATITIKNELAEAATISFDWEAINVNQLTIDGTKNTNKSGSFSKQNIDAGGSFTVTITTAKNSTENKLIIKKFAIVGENSSNTVTLEHTDGGTITADGTEQTSGAQLSIGASGVLLAAKPAGGAEFVAWIDTADNRVLSQNESFSLFPDKALTAKAIFSEDDAHFFVDNNEYLYHYSTWDSAMTAATASSSKTAILANNANLPTGDYTIPSGVTLLIPYNSENTCPTTKPTTVEYTQPTEYRKLTLASGAKIAVDGAISVGGQICAASGGVPIIRSSTCGNYGHISMNSGSEIIMNGSLYVYGFITGEGTITANSAAKIHEVFEIREFRGGSATSTMISSFGENKRTYKVFPFSQYYIQNIESALTMTSGATLTGHCALAMTGQTEEPALTIVGKSSGLFRLSDGTLTKTYSPSTDRCSMVVDGSVNIANTTLKVSIYTLDTGDYTLPINGHFDIELKSGTTATISENTSLLPGATFTVDSGAELTIANGKSLYVYDSDEWVGKNYVFPGSSVAAYNYSPVRSHTRGTADLTDVVMDVNGTITVNGNFCTTAGGASIISSEGTGVVNFTADSAAGSLYQVLQPDDLVYEKIATTSAKLKNGDGSYVDTTKNTYYYGHDKWWPAEHTFTDSVTDPTCTEQGYTTHTCVCGYKYQDTETSALGHSWKDATCTAPKTCSICGTTEGEALGHQYENGLCSCGKGVKFTIKHNLGLADLVQIGYWIQVESVDTEVTDYGLLIWDEDAYEAETDYTVTSSTAYQPELMARMGYQQGYGEGIFAQFLDTKYYAVPYVVTADDTTLYGDVDVYSVPQYATQMDGQSQIVQQTVYDLLNYGTFAQYYFVSRNGGDVSGLTAINSVSPEEKQKNRYTDSMKVNALTDYKDTDNSLACNWLYTTAELESAIALNFFAKESDTFSGMLYWNDTDYTKANSLVYGTQTTVLTVENRTIYNSNTTTGQIGSIYAKNIFDWQYACMYNLTEETYTYGPLRVDSVAAYLTRMIDTYSSSAEVTDTYLVNTCKAMLAYGDSARTYAGK